MSGSHTGNLRTSVGIDRGCPQGPASRSGGCGRTAAGAAAGAAAALARGDEGVGVRGTEAGRDEDFAAGGVYVDEAVEVFGSGSGAAGGSVFALVHAGIKYPAPTGMFQNL